MFRQSIRTDAAPAPIGAYSQALRVGETVYLSGQIGLDPATMALVSDEPAAQIRQALQNLAAVARAAGGSLADFAKITAYLTDLSDYAVVSEVMEEFFAAPYPARAVIGVAALPRGALFEAEAILVLPT